MSIRTTVTLDEDIVDRVKKFSRERGVSFREALNNLLRAALVQQGPQRKRNVAIPTFDMGAFAHLDYNNVEGLLEYGESEAHR